MANLPCLTSAPMGQVEGFVWRFRTMFSKPNRSRSSSRPVGSNGPLYQQTMSGCCSCPGSRTASRKSTKPSGPPTSSGGHPGYRRQAAGLPHHRPAKALAAHPRAPQLEDVRIHDLSHRCASWPDFLAAKEVIKRCNWLSFSLFPKPPDIAIYNPKSHSHRIHYNI